MQRLAIAPVMLFFAAILCAQSPAPAPQLAISQLTLTGGTQISPSDQQALLAEVKSHRYEPDQSGEIKQRVLYGFQQLGFFKAKVSDPVVIVLNDNGGMQMLSVSLSVDEGRQYRLKSISVNGAKAFSEAQLRSQFPIKDGDIFNTEKIRAGLDDLRKMYASQGYLNFTPVPNTEVDDATAVVSLLVDADEGKQFHFGRLVLDGEEPQAGTGAKLIEAWKPYEGKLYDYRLVEQYWQKIQPLLPPGLKLENTLAMKQDPQAGIVIAGIDFPDPK